MVKKVSLKEQVADFDPQPVITKDNVTMQIDTVIYFQITDPKLYTYGVEHPMNAIENLTATTLRNIIGEMELDQSLTSRDVINAKMRSILDEATDPWGIKVNRVELKNILPPKEIQNAMEKQMKAERERRESILQAEGQKQSQILVAEGESSPPSSRRTPRSRPPSSTPRPSVRRRGAPRRGGPGPPGRVSPPRRPPPTPPPPPPPTIRSSSSRRSNPSRRLPTGRRRRSSFPARSRALPALPPASRVCSRTRRSKSRTAKESAPALSFCNSFVTTFPQRHVIM